VLQVSKPQCSAWKCIIRSRYKEKIGLGPRRKSSQQTCFLSHLPPPLTVGVALIGNLNTLSVEITQTQKNSEKKLENWLSQCSFLRPQLEAHLNLSEAVSITTKPRRTNGETFLLGTRTISFCCCYCCCFLSVCFFVLFVCCFCYWSCFCFSSLFPLRQFLLFLYFFYSVFLSF
jgi:hypothetical protein